MECEVRSHRRIRTALALTPSQLFQAIDILVPETGKHTTTLVLGRVKRLHIRNDAVVERQSASAHALSRTVDITKTQYAARLGDISYTGIGPFFRIPRASWESDKDKVEALQKGGEASA